MLESIIADKCANICSIYLYTYQTHIPMCCISSTSSVRKRIYCCCAICDKARTSSTYALQPSPSLCLPLSFPPTLSLCIFLPLCKSSLTDVPLYPKGACHLFWSLFVESQREVSATLLLLLPAATPARACGSDKGRPACCNAAVGFALVYLLMVYLLIPADYHVRQGRKRDTARGRHRKRICQEGWRRGKVLGQGWQCWALDKAYRVLDNCG